MMRISVDLMISKTLGLMNWRRWAKSAPATPAKNEETTKASIFMRRVSMPDSSAAISSSLIERMPLPKRE